MTAEYEKARRHANNTLAEVNRHLDSGKIKNPQHHQMLTDMAEKATRTLRNIDEMENRRPYSDTNIGYNADTRDDAMRGAMDAIDKILPHIADVGDTNDMNAVEARRGVRGTGRGRKRVRVGGYTRRADMDDAADMDYADEARLRAEHEQRINDHEQRMRMHEQRMREHEQRMAANPQSTKDIYPGTPVMPHNAARNDADMTADRMRQAGPGMDR